MKPIFEKVSEQLKQENSKVQLYTTNVEQNKDFAIDLGIRSIPTIKCFSDGTEVLTKVGLQQEKQLQELVNNLING